MKVKNEQVGFTRLIYVIFFLSNSGLDFTMEGQNVGVATPQVENDESKPSVHKWLVAMTKLSQFMTSAKAAG